MSKKQSTTSALSYILSAFILTIPFAALASEHSPEEHVYLATLKEKHSTAPRVLTVDECRKVIDEACIFIGDATGHHGAYDSEDAKDLLFGTACMESSLRPRYQDHSGHAIGLFQIEYPTFKDIWHRFVPQHHPDLHTATEKHFDGVTYEKLQESDVLSAIIARMKYAEIPAPIPHKNDSYAQAAYYKQYYNSPAGKATPEAYIKNKREILAKHHTPHEHHHLSTLKEKHSEAPRVLTVDQCRKVIDEACSFIANATDRHGVYDSDDAKDLLFGTACMESDLRPRYQDDSGHAIGLFQIEYQTFKDVWGRFIKQGHPDLYAAMQKHFGVVSYEKLQENDVLCAIIARMKYAESSTAIPHYTDLHAQAEYYKKYYNTPKGDATPEEYMRKKKDILHLHHEDHEHEYLAELKEKHSHGPRTLTVEECLEVIDEACAFISKATGHPSYASEDAKDLLFGTACIESSLRPRYQDHSGHAIGLFQIEYPTFKDVWHRSIFERHPDLYHAVEKHFDGVTYEKLQESDVLSAIIARMKYAEIPKPIPHKNNIQAQAAYYKKYYNTPLGKATPEKYIENKKSFSERK